jgi:hypothetical protein
MPHNKFVKVIIITLVALIFGSVATAFAASNTVPVTNSGDGVGIVSGYVVSNVLYGLNAIDPSKIDTVRFTLNAAATTVKIKLVAAGTTYYTCTVVTGNNWTCPSTVTQATVLTADQLRVIASQ